VIEAARVLKEAGVPSPLGFGWQSWTMIENFSAWHDLPIGHDGKRLCRHRDRVDHQQSPSWPISTVFRTWLKKACSSTAGVAATRVRNS
jgi:hypothetical protein